MDSSWQYFLIRRLTLLCLQSNRKRSVVSGTLQELTDPVRCPPPLFIPGDARDDDQSSVRSVMATARLDESAVGRMVRYSMVFSLFIFDFRHFFR